MSDLTSMRIGRPSYSEWEVEAYCPHCEHYCHATIDSELGCSTSTIHSQCEHAELVRGEWEFYSDEDLA